MNSENNEINAKALKYYRTEMDYSQEELAKKIRVSPNTISRWELGNFKVKEERQEELATVLGIKTKQLRATPPTKMKADPRAPYTFSPKAKLALDIISETYHINRDEIIDFVPFLFHAFAAASLGKRATNLNEMDQEIEKLMEYSREKLPYLKDGIFIEDTSNNDYTFEEKEAINNNQLFVSSDITDDINDISVNPFSQFLKSFMDIMPEKLEGHFKIEWKNDELPKYYISDSYIREVLVVPVDNELLEKIKVLILNGKMQFKEINVLGSGLSIKAIEELKEEILNQIKAEVMKKYSSYQKKMKAG